MDTYILVVGRIASIDLSKYTVCLLIAPVGHNVEVLASEFVNSDMD